ncbi:O-antigen ligase family protein [bacterium]|nr:MAG: O-antigen ligase family protein [bacterium]
MKAFLQKIDEYTEKHRLITVFLAIFLFFQPFRPYAGIRSAAFVTVLVLFSIRLIRGSAKIPFTNKAVQALILLAAVCLVSSLLGPYAIESLNAIRKNLLYQIVVFAVIVTEYRNFDEIKPLLFSIFAGFTALSTIIIFKNSPSVLLHWLDRANKENIFLGGYSTHATFFIPLLTAYIFAFRRSPGKKAGLVAMLLLWVGLSFLNNHRTQILAFGLAMFLIAALSRRYKALIAGAVLCLALIAALYGLKPESFTRYKTLLNPYTYVTDNDEALNGRLAIWRGTIDMIKVKPVLGYGYGWKKIASVAVDKGFLEKWNKNGATYKYFSATSHGTTNPHNLVLQILFEIGIIGLCAFLLFWVVVIAKAVKAPLKEQNDEGRFLKYATAGVLLSYAVINITNGVWQEAMGVLIMAFAAFTVVLAKRQTETS